MRGTPGPPREAETTEFRGSGQRFEVDSAEEARRFLRTYQVPDDSIRRVRTAIALHTTPGIPQSMEPEVALVTAGVEYDVLVPGYQRGNFVDVILNSDWPE